MRSLRLLLSVKSMIGVERMASGEMWGGQSGCAHREHRCRPDFIIGLRKRLVDYDKRAQQPVAPGRAAPSAECRRVRRLSFAPWDLDRDVRDELDVMSESDFHAAEPFM